MEGRNNEDTEAGIYAGIQGTGGQAGEGWAVLGRGSAGMGAGRADPAQLGQGRSGRPAGGGRRQGGDAGGDGMVPATG